MKKITQKFPIKNMNRSSNLVQPTSSLIRRCDGCGDLGRQRSAFWLRFLETAPESASFNRPQGHGARLSEVASQATRTRALSGATVRKEQRLDDGGATPIRSLNARLKRARCSAGCGVGGSRFLFVWWFESQLAAGEHLGTLSRLAGALHGH